MPILFDLYLTFFRIGILTFGGGLTMLPLLKYELVESKKWISEENAVSADEKNAEKNTSIIIITNKVVFILSPY